MAIRNLKIETEDLRRKREKKRREKERKKRRIHKFGQTELKHAKRGKLSCYVAFCSAFLMMLIFSVSYISRGDVNIGIGFVGLVVLVLSANGVRWGYEGLKERNKKYMTCKIGMGCNGLILLVFIMTFVRGLF